MMWSTMTARISRAVVSAAARTVHPPAFSVVARRTLFATPQLSFPAAKASEAAAKKTTGKTTEKKEKKASKGVKKEKKKPKKEIKATTRIPKDLKPPKQAPNPYILFFTSFLKTQPKPGTLLEVQELSKRASGIWKGYSMAEKQPFYDENEVRKVQVKQEKDEFFRKTSAADLKLLNSIRTAKKKPKYHRTNKTPRALTAFFQFTDELRQSPDGQALMNEAPPGEKKIVHAVKVAGKRWQSMSSEEKEPYFEKFRKAKEELKAEAK